MVVAETIAGLGAIKTAFDLTKAIKDLDDRTRRNEAVIDLQQKILTAQEAQAALIKRIGELEEDLARMKTWEAENGLHHAALNSVRSLFQSTTDSTSIGWPILSFGHLWTTRW